ncbi:hypothetical protein [Bacteroides mediterraneensis]|uniref:Uncharacterized protein n=1 Tax=Bacteroides mediterraneensis TaxID=1841856 RepID=A0ABS2EYB8_9BACE|nr:hypothetical protein [Bacteroides mediterraneensis]MBM6759670.1 hypothetical protein [Bacteroides mediterraneensis]
MRTGTINGCSIKYPDDVVFCFNPNMITVNTSSEVTFVISSDGGGIGGVFDSTFDRTFTIVKKPYFEDNRDEYNSYVELDISAYLQACFDINRNSGMVESKVVHVKVTISGESLEFDLTVIWGAMNIGETFNAPRTVTNFTKYPFTVTFFDQKIRHVSVSDVPEYIKVVNNDSEEGVYLRWIDRHGFYQYWLFQEGTNESKSEEYGEQLLDNFYGSQYGYYGVSRMQGKETEETKKACATLVDKDTFNMLLTVHSSPLVDMYVDGNWIPVRVKDSTTSDNGEHLQDFEIEIILPGIISQSL